MCDVCAEFLDLLQSYEERISKESDEHPVLQKDEVETVMLYIQSWSQRQCMCCFRDSKNYERFNLITQSIICLAVCQLKELREDLVKAKPPDKKTVCENGDSKEDGSKQDETDSLPVDTTCEGPDGSKSSAGESDQTAEADCSKRDCECKDKEVKNKNDCDDEQVGEATGEEEEWSLQDKEKLLHFLSKVFLLNFPLYVAYKHTMQSKLEEITQQEAGSLNVFCDLHDPEIPVYLLRNVCLFCRSGGVHAMTFCFEHQSPDTLPVSLAHAMIAIVCNLKLWLNFRSIMQLFVPLRSKVLRYMCNLADKDLRSPGIKTMADFMWSAVKDPLDSPLTFDRDGLDLAFKYFTSSTLTMRLAGIAQINSHINMFNELCNSESIVEVESVGQSLANWLIDNQIISHIFGPNLHVEVIKQSHVILSFLAMECKITDEHVDVIWQAAQLKHCSKQVHDLLPPLIKHLEAGPVLHLYGLLCKLEPRDHTEQSLYLASALIKFIWTSGGTYSQMTTDAPFLGLGKAAIAGLKGHHRDVTSSENSVSMEASNSEDEQVDSSQQSDIHKTHSETSEGPTPCKQPCKRKKQIQRVNPEIESSDGSAKIEELEEDEDDEEDEEEEEEEEELDEVHKEVYSIGDADMKREQTSDVIVKHSHRCKATVSAAKLCDGTNKVQINSDNEVEADAEKSGTEEIPNKIKKKRRKMLRRRKMPKKDKLVLCEHVKHVDCSDEEGDSNSDEDVRPSSEAIVVTEEYIDGFEPDQEVPNVLVRDPGSDFVQIMEDHSHDSSHDSTRGGVMTELASFVQGSEIHDCQPYIRNFQTHRELMEEMLSGEEGSYSSRMSNKSEKNMADFDGEESGCEDELAQLAAQAHLSPHSIPQHLSNMAFHSRFHTPKLPSRSGLQEVTRVCSQFKMENVCKPGSTLLWDLLQDDKIAQLGEGLALEAEKALCNLLCFNTERLIRMKFIEGCLQNLANNRSVVVSLRLLPKLFASFQQFRGMDTHQITTWAEKEHNMMECFFNNLKVYTKEGPHTNLYSHQTEIQVRLQFLTSVFSPVGSPDNFRLSLGQVDTLWGCLATDKRCADELFSWLLSQAKSKEQHALGVDTLKHLYMKKLPSLEPESMSMTGLALFQQLCNLARLATAHLDSPLKDVDAVGMDHLWKIALKANNTDVSMAAIQYLNSYYVGRQLDHESEFVSQCMAHLAAASKDLVVSEESSLLCIQRALLLLKTHLETFRRRYAYHLRRWALEGQGVGSHVQLPLGERGCMPLRVVIQPAGVAEKATLELLSGDYVADLRAEVVTWWEGLQSRTSGGDAGSGNTPVLGSLLSEGPIRMITQGQELTTEFDEKTLQEMGFKDLQLVFISMGASRQQKKRDTVDTPSAMPPPPRESLPTLLLLQPQYFEQLFCLMHTLSSMRTPVKGGHQIPHTKAQVLSRRVWDILTLLPTSPILLRGFQALDGTGPSLQELLDPASPQKLMYSLYIVESLGCPSASSKRSSSTKGGDNVPDKLHDNWNETFVQHGGLRHLFDIFMSGTLQRSGGDGSEWQQDCLALLLKLLCQLGMTTDSGELPPDLTDSVRNKRNRRFRKSSSDKVVIPKLSEAMLMMMDVDLVMPRLTSILYEASLPRDPNHYKTGFWGRAQVVHYAMALLVSWVHSSEKVRQALFAAPHFSTWMQRLVLEDPEPAVRREVCTALYRLCLGSSSGDQTPPSFNLTPHMLSHLMEYLPIAESMRPPKMETIHQTNEEGKEPYGPACRDYFWLLCRLVDGLHEDLIRESIEDPQGCVIDIDDLAKRLSKLILSREYLEMRHNTTEDDGLIGLLNLMSNVLKHNPPFKTCKEGQEFLSQVFDFLFALPNPRKRYVPKCKSQLSRSSAFDLLVELVKGAPENYKLLHEKLLAQHEPGPHSPYPWDYWPHEDGRSDCGYVGLTNLGATCYMASCMQHLYMMPQARSSILQAKCDGNSKHELTLRELQRMFAYLLESERKAYNPRSFCKVYTMDHQPLNTGEQKDMAEFFIDLVSKLEEMTPELKKLVKTLFGGVISNNVVSLDCDHVSRTLEEFYTVRCQVADMRNLYESLDEVTVKDTLEGDNMYTCSQCGKKVRAEKRACFKKLPHILCFNTMRYTFNMVTMLKEKVNTHFSFPLRLDMSGYVEKHLMPQRYQEEKRKSQLRKSEHSKDNVKEDENKKEEEEHEDSDSEDFNECYEYDLIGVTVHTGTADGGHYYSFIRDRTTSNRDKWFLFNDAEVKPFDPNQIAAECFGGEMTSKTYDSVTDKFMDFSFEKTNSAYMLFYEWCSRDGEQRSSWDEVLDSDHHSLIPSAPVKCGPTFELSKELEDWIWQDNMHFLKDKNIFEHTYFNFMWQVCGYIPQTLLSQQHDITEVAAQLSTSFFLETFIHAKEKPTMVQWVELLTKQFNASQAACEWFLDHMANNDWWPVQILIKCPNQIVRQMFQRLCIHVIQRLRANHAPLYLKPDPDDDGSGDGCRIGNQSCVTRFIKMLLSLMENGAKAHLKHLSEYFCFLNEFSKMGEEESQFLIQVQAISMMVNFYLGQKAQDYVEVVSEDEEEEDVVPLPTDKYKPGSLEKMITLIATLVERSRGPDHLLKLSTADFTAIAGGKGFPFLYQQIKDGINLNQTRNLIYALCRWNERLAVHIVAMLFQAITKHTEICQPFFKLLTLMTEPTSGPSGLPSFTQLVLHRIWEVAEFCPQSALDWLAVQVPRNKLAHSWVLTSMESWVEHFLLSHNIQRVRSAAAYLLVSLVPSPHFRQGYRATRHLASPHKELLVGSEAQLVLHQVYTFLLHLLKPARHYTDIQTHGTMKLTAYFALLTYCVVSRTEKLMFGQYFLDLWQLFHPKLSEPSIPVHHNKQALLLFWHHVCVDCPENVQLILQNAHVTKNIAFNYILADHEDQDVVLFNRGMLPAYYGLLRLCCQHSRTFTRQLASHQNLHWAFKNITPHPTQYSAAVDELFKLIQLFVMRFPESTEQEIHEINTFRRQTLQLYLQVLDGRSCWATLILAFRTLIDNDDDRLFVVYNGGLQMAFEAFQTLHAMYHEATACHVSGDMLELLALLLDIIKCLRLYRDIKEIRNNKEWVEVLRKLATLLNTYNSADMRNLCIDLLKEMLLLLPQEVIQVLVPLLSHCHAAFQENHNALPMGPYFPRRGHKLPPIGLKTSTRPSRPMVQMAVPHGQLDAAKGVDEEYDQALLDFYSPYHEFIDVMCRLAINNDCMSDSLVNLSAMVGFEGVPLHLTFFPKLWLDIYHAQHVDKKYMTMLNNCNYFVDYMEAVLLDERTSLNVGIIYDFLCTYFPKVASHVLTEQTCNLIENLTSSLTEISETMDVQSQAYKLNGDLRALTIVYSCDVPLAIPEELLPALDQLLSRSKAACSHIEEGEVSVEEAPSKKRKLSLEKEEGDSSISATAAGCSKDCEDERPASASPSSDQTESSGKSSTKTQFSMNWLELLEKTIIDLKAVIEKKG
ncbi:ubiquitin carboxyl-terminal hydrolase puf [Anabrus simplex]|uniref:ubiquitin carboxyl-terminal hydrolase puf n=1 Tax=Anabrus simplex TaxID=316456 RepID=UPI0035A294F8